MSAESKHGQHSTGEDQRAFRHVDPYSALQKVTFS
jgi:hypothetical protein